MRSRLRQSPRTEVLIGLGASVLGLGDIALYLLVLASQSGPSETTRPMFIASFVGAMALLSAAGAIGSLRQHRFAGVLFLAAGTGNTAIGLLGTLSVGAALVLAGVLLLAIAFQNGSPLGLKLPIVLSVLAVMALGFRLTG